MNSRTAWIGCVLAVAAVGCGCHPRTPTAPSSHLPPNVVAVFPAGRTAHVPDTTRIWVRFAEPLDPETVDSTTVFLKIDTRRQLAAVTWDSTSRTVLIAPRRPLRLAETYTVELSPNLSSLSGGRMGETYFWQFTITGVRLAKLPLPASGTTDESPFAPLSWEGTEESAGDVAYEVYVSTDSSRVAERSLAPVARTPRTSFLAPDRFATGSTYFWAVTTLNRTTDEVLPGPVWRFATLAESSPVDSLEVPATQWGYFYRLQRSNQSFCFQTILRSGPDYVCGFAWDLPQLDVPQKLAGASIALSTTSTAPSPSELWSTTAPVPAVTCAFGFPGPPTRHDRLADGVHRSPFVVYESEPLTMHLAAIQRGIGVYGYALSSVDMIRFTAPPTLKLYFYR